MVLVLKPDMLETPPAVTLVSIFFSFNDAHLLIRHLQGDTTTSSGITTGTDNQYSTTGHHGHGEGHLHKHHLGGDHSHEATGTSAKPKVTDTIIGKAEKLAGKVTSNTEMYQRGEERVSWLSTSVRSVLNVCFNHQGWRDRKEELLSRSISGWPEGTSFLFVWSDLVVTYFHFEDDLKRHYKPFSPPCIIGCYTKT